MFRKKSICICWSPWVFYVFLYTSSSFFCSPSGVCTWTWTGSRSRLLCSGLSRWPDNRKVSHLTLPYGGTDHQADQWDQESWPRCCWDGQRCLCQWSMWPAVKLGKDRIRLAASPAPWTRGRCSGFDAVARRRWEGKGGDLCVCRCHSFLALFDCGSILTNCVEEKNSDFPLHAELISMCSCI